MDKHLRQLLRAKILSLLLVDILCQNSLVLKHIALHLQVQAMIPLQDGKKTCSFTCSCFTHDAFTFSCRNLQMTVDLLRLSVLA